MSEILIAPTRCITFVGRVSGKPGDPLVFGGNSPGALPLNATSFVANVNPSLVRTKKVIDVAGYKCNVYRLVPAFQLAQEERSEKDKEGDQEITLDLNDIRMPVEQYEALTTPEKYQLKGGKIFRNLLDHLDTMVTFSHGNFASAVIAFGSKWVSNAVQELGTDWVEFLEDHGHYQTILAYLTSTSTAESKALLKKIRTKLNKVPTLNEKIQAILDAFRDCHATLHSTAEDSDVTIKQDTNNAHDQTKKRAQEIINQNGWTNGLGNHEPCGEWPGIAPTSLLKTFRQYATAKAWVSNFIRDVPRQSYVFTWLMSKYQSYKTFAAETTSVGVCDAAFRMGIQEQPDPDAGLPEDVSVLDLYAWTRDGQQSFRFQGSKEEAKLVMEKKRYQAMSGKIVESVYKAITPSQRLDRVKFKEDTIKLYEAVLPRGLGDKSLKVLQELCEGEGAVVAFRRIILKVLANVGKQIEFSGLQTLLKSALEKAVTEVTNTNVKASLEELFSAFLNDISQSGQRENKERANARWVCKMMAVTSANFCAKKVNQVITSDPQGTADFAMHGRFYRIKLGSDIDSEAVELLGEDSTATSLPSDAAIVDGNFYEEKNKKQKERLKKFVASGLTTKKSDKIGANLPVPSMINLPVGTTGKLSGVSGVQENAVTVTREDDSLKLEGTLAAEDSGISMSDDAELTFISERNEKATYPLSKFGITDRMLDAAELEDDNKCWKFTINFGEWKSCTGLIGDVIINDVKAGTYRFSPMTSDSGISLMLFVTPNEGDAAKFTANDAMVRIPPTREFSFTRAELKDTAFDELSGQTQQYVIPEEIEDHDLVRIHYEVAKLRTTLAREYVDTTEEKFHRDLRALTFREQVLSMPKDVVPFGQVDLGVVLGLVARMVEHVGDRTLGESLFTNEPTKKLVSLMDLDLSKSYPVNRALDLANILVAHSEVCEEDQNSNAFRRELQQVAATFDALSGTNSKVTFINQTLREYVTSITPPDRAVQSEGFFISQPSLLCYLLDCSDSQAELATLDTLLENAANNSGNVGFQYPLVISGGNAAYWWHAGIDSFATLKDTVSWRVGCEFDPIFAWCLSILRPAFDSGTDWKAQGGWTPKTASLGAALQFMTAKHKDPIWNRLAYNRFMNLAVIGHRAANDGQPFTDDFVPYLSQAWPNNVNAALSIIPGFSNADLPKYTPQIGGAIIFNANPTGVGSEMLLNTTSIP